ncbi:MAG: O-antigen ligase family protein [Chloroflexota bacterium]|nr:O-antigen ligase family protein [Chloroflexota bacterium]
MTSARMASPARAGVVLAAFGAALVCGGAMAIRPGAGLALVLGLGFVPLAFFNLPMALALVAPLALLRYLPAVSVGPTLAFAVVLMAWLGTLASRGSRAAVRLGQWRAVWLIAITLIWLAISVAWAEDRQAAGEQMIDWGVAAVLALMYFTTLLTERQIRLAIGGFVFGALIAVCIGLASTGLRPAPSALETATYTEGRLQAGGADPNYLAAWLVPAIVLAGGLMASTRSALHRCAILFGAAIIMVGLAATQSRGGLLAAIAAAVVALLVMRGHRLQVAAAMAIAVGLIGFWLAISPGALERVSTSDGGGSGRTDLWTVAWRVAEDHPLIGVGVGNFQHVSAAYVRRPGQLTFVEFVVDEPHLVHNSYLQVLAENGVIGLLLYATVLLVFLAASWRVARQFDARGDLRLATLARSLFVAQISVMVAIFFISAAPSAPFWLLCGVSGALLMHARA